LLPDPSPGRVMIVMITSIGTENYRFQHYHIKRHSIGHSLPLYFLNQGMYDCIFREFSSTVENLTLAFEI